MFYWIDKIPHTKAPSTTKPLKNILTAKFHKLTVKILRKETKDAKKKKII